MTEDRYQIVFSDDADKQLKKLDKSVQRRILVAIVKLEEDPRPQGVKKLKGNNDFWRIRVNDWRVIYQINDGKLTILVLEIGHRSKIYRNG